MTKSDSVENRIFFKQGWVEMFISAVDDFFYQYFND